MNKIKFQCSTCSNTFNLNEIDRNKLCCSECGDEVTPKKDPGHVVEYGTPLACMGDDYPISARVTYQCPHCQAPLSELP